MDTNNSWLDFMKMVEQIMTEKYGIIVVDHAKNPRNIARIKDPNGYATYTGECGDAIEVWLKVIDDTIKEISFKFNGCEITKAAVSMATELVKEKKLSEALKINPPCLVEALGGLPDDHIHCASLAMGAVHEAINNFIKGNKSNK
ncbi:MAG: iron-sulfur cluster assembly scaffold protein [Bacillota bacterium]|jgi:nitrogen fixation NifU-like protein